MQTAFLFDRPDAVSLDDLHRSIVAFIRALIGTENKADGARAGGSFASTFINRAVGRNATAPDGIGLHPASTALAAQLTIPADDIADILAARLVAQAATELGAARTQEDNRGAIEAFIAAAGLTPLRDRSARDPLPSLPADVEGDDEIARLLRERDGAARSLVARRESELGAEVAQLAGSLKADAGVREILKTHDIFHADRIVRGEPKLADGVSRAGVDGFVGRRAQAVDAPKDSGFKAEAPPSLPSLHDEMFGLKKVKLDDDQVKAAISAQERWYEWRVRRAWHMAWNSHQDLWRPRFEAIATQLKEIGNAFEAHANKEPAEFRSSCTVLYSEREGVVYFLPDGGPGRNLDHFYKTQLIPRLLEKAGLESGKGAGAILQSLVADDWAEVFDRGAESGTAALDLVLDVVSDEISAVLTSRVKESTPLLPPLSVLLSQMVAPPNSLSDTERDIAARFQTSLASLRPLGFEPPGTGTLKTEVFYPANTQSNAIETYLRGALNMPTARFEQIADTNFLGVVMTREAVHAEDVPLAVELVGGGPVG